MKWINCLFIVVLLPTLCVADVWHGWLVGPSHASIPFERTAQGKAYVTIAIKDHKLRFLVDTGGTTLIDAQVAKEIGLSPVAAGDTATTLIGSGGERYVVTTDFSIDKFKLGQYPLTCLDLSYFKKLEQPEIVGVIGADLLTLFRARIDYDTGELTLRKPKP